jgi:uncharacterized protein (DUF342 family)
MTETTQLEDRPDEAAEPDVPEVLLEPTADGLTLLLTCSAPGEDPAPLLDALARALLDLGIPEPPSREELAERLTALADGPEPLVRAVLLEGQPAVPPVHERLEWAEDFFAEGFAADADTGAVDYWERREHLDVQGEQLLARVHPARSGTAGRDVFGREIPVEAAREVQIATGPEVRCEEESDGCRSFRATASGRLRWAGGTLAVDQVYTIRGDVSLETGNVRHPGAVVVTGDVKAGATIEAEGDVVVQGMVEPCDIRATGSLTVRGGVLGGEGHHIELGGGLQARYLNEVDVTAADDIVVVNEISRSQVRTRGSVQLPKGRITASEVTALRGILVEQAGGQGLSTTLLAAGVDHRLAGEVRQRREKITQLERRLEKIAAALETARAAARQRPAGPDPQQQAGLARLEAEHARYRQAITGLERGIAEWHRTVREQAREWIQVTRRTYPDTVLQIGEARTRIERLIEEPRRFTRHGREIFVEDEPPA